LTVAVKHVLPDLDEYIRDEVVNGQPMQHDPQGYDLVGDADFYVKDKILVD
jgi:hypothetical protein